MVTVNICYLGRAPVISVEDTFNRNSTLCCERPYESEIFHAVQEGNISTMMHLLQSGQASIHDVDPYGLGLLYVRLLFCYIRDSVTNSSVVRSVLLLERSWAYTSSASLQVVDRNWCK